jgi:hypothetical protein
MVVKGVFTFWQGCVHFPHFSMVARAILCLLAVICKMRQAGQKSRFVNLSDGLVILQNRNRLFCLV